MAWAVTVCAMSVLLCINAAPAPECKERLSLDEVGLCNPNGTVDIWHCPICQPGYGQSVECGRMYPAGTAVSCVLCKRNHTYSDTYDISQCKPCTQCQDNEVKNGQCEPNKDTIKCTCKAGHYRDTHSRGCLPCSWCCSDKRNETVKECNIPEVPLGKRCSFQTTQSCAPTTPVSVPSPITAASTNEKSSSTHLIPTKKMLTRSESTVTVTDSSDDTNKSSDTEKESATWKLNEKLIPAVIASILMIGFFLILELIHYLVKRKGSINWIPCQSTGDSARRLLQPGSGIKVDSSEPGEHVVLNDDEATAAYHIEPKQGPSGVQQLPADGNVPLPTTRLDEEKLCFICEKLGPNISDLEFDVRHTLCKMLNVTVNHKDYNNLDKFCNLDYYDQKRLQQSEKMAGIIDIMITQLVTLRSFLEELYTISRGDVVYKLYMIAEGRTH